MPLPDGVGLAMNLIKFICLFCYDLDSAHTLTVKVATQFFFLLLLTKVSSLGEPELSLAKEI